MGSFVSPITEVVKVLWRPVWNQIGYVYYLEENIQALKIAMGELSAKDSDVRERVRSKEEYLYVKRTHEVENWLHEVKELKAEVGHAFPEDSEHDQMKRPRRWFPGNCWSTYKMGKKIYQMLNDAKELKSKGEFAKITFSLPRPTGSEMPTEPTVGLENMLSKVRECLIHEKDVETIGIYGIGGVGKTALMKIIHNDLLHKAVDFNVIIWVDVSERMNLKGIQNSIRKKLSIESRDWENHTPHEKAIKLYEVLSNKKFVLFIDDLQDWLDLSKVGVPHPNFKKSKVVFTTRFEQVCSQMVADKSFKVQPLTLEKSLLLLEQKVGKEALSQKEILELAKETAMECEGLPLALITVGRAMAGRKNPNDWKYSLEVLKNNPPEFDGMVDKVYKSLEFSYNSLNNPTLQCCFLYCCIFPRGYKIGRDYLINLWIGEGLLGEINDVHKERIKGEHFIESLKMACLLESTSDKLEGDCLKMHNVIHNMATWIACDKTEKNNKILVEEDQRELSSHMFSIWKEAERICMCGLGIENIGQAPSLNSKLKTLILRGTKVRCLPPGFFSSMKTALRVLDFSNNDDLEELSGEIGELTNLQHLDLSNTRIKDLPLELKKLTLLRCLILDGTPCLSNISKELILSLSRLNLFSHWMDYVNQGISVGSKDDLIDALGSAEELSDVSIQVSTSSCAATLLNHTSLRIRIRRARICFCKDLTNIKVKFSSHQGSFSQLKEFLIMHCTELKKIKVKSEAQGEPNVPMFPSLRRVHIHNCAAIKNLSWLVQAPNLQKLKVTYCHRIEKIVHGLTEKEASRLFSNLETLDLYNLQSLTRICDYTPPFPSLKNASIEQCPKLDKENRPRSLLRNTNLLESANTSGTLVSHIGHAHVSLGESEYKQTI